MGSGLLSFSLCIRAVYLVREKCYTHNDSRFQERCEEQCFADHFLVKMPPNFVVLRNASSWEDPGFVGEYGEVSDAPTAPPKLNCSAVGSEAFSVNTTTGHLYSTNPASPSENLFAPFGEFFDPTRPSYYELTDSFFQTCSQRSCMVRTPFDNPFLVGDPPANQTSLHFDALITNGLDIRGLTHSSRTIVSSTGFNLTYQPRFESVCCSLVTELKDCLREKCGLPERGFGLTSDQCPEYFPNVTCADDPCFGNVSLPGIFGQVPTQNDCRDDPWELVHSCTCRRGFYQAINRKTNRETCVNIDDCAWTPANVQRLGASSDGPLVCGDPRNVCQDRIAGHECVCAPGFAAANFTWQQPGPSSSYYSPVRNDTCVDIDDCLGDPCGDHPNACFNGIGGVGNYTCGCAPGYRLDPSTGDETCVDIDECLELRPCGEARRDRWGIIGEKFPLVSPIDHQCTNTAGSYLCFCAPGYRNDTVVCPRTTLNMSNASMWAGMNATYERHQSNSTSVRMLTELLDMHAALLADSDLDDDSVVQLEGKERLGEGVLSEKEIHKISGVLQAHNAPWTAVAPSEVLTNAAKRRLKSSLG